jgi:cystathionine beta-lyase
MFDTFPDRTDTDSLKWSRYRGKDILPMWVADMDFACAEPIVEALRRRVSHGVFGYAVARPADYEAVIHWVQERHRWTIRKEWIVWIPGLVPGLHVTCRAFAEPGQDVASFTPVYPPFLSAPVLSDRRLVTCPLASDNGRYTFDLDALAKIVTPQTRVLLLCSPHNPVGRVWTRQELLDIAHFCLDRDILICSDEIHCDLVLDAGSTHVPTALLSPEIAERTVTLMSPAKTFNLPGLNCGFAIIPNDTLRRRFIRTAQGILPHVNVMGYTACRAAFTQCGPWQQELIATLRGNRDYLTQSINALPGLSMGPVEATYLAWIDARSLNVTPPAAWFEQAGVGVNDGADFDGAGFVRLNFGCPRRTLELAVQRLQTALESR